MKHYAIYDLKTGQILQTHAVVNVGGESQDVPDDDILATLPPTVSRQSVGVTTFDKTRESGSTFSVDVKSGNVIATASGRRP